MLEPALAVWRRDVCDRIMTVREAVADEMTSQLQGVRCENSRVSPPASHPTSQRLCGMWQRMLHRWCGC
jgi:hypothetical protein